MCVRERERERVLPVKKNLRHSVFYPLVSLPSKVHPRGKVLIKMTLSYKVNQGGYLKKGPQKVNRQSAFFYVNIQICCTFLHAPKTSTTKIEKFEVFIELFLSSHSESIFKPFWPRAFVGLPI